MVLANIVFVLPRLVDDHKLLLHQLSKLHLLPPLVDRQLSLFEFSDGEDVVAVPVVPSGLDASRCPDQSSLNCKNRIPCCNISFIS
jgi:hypothetical protein